MEESNIPRLERVADALGDLNERVTYVGGSVAGLYPQMAAAPSRPTIDVDCVVEYFSFKEKEEFEELLRQKHFQEDIEGGVICRWLYGKEIVDIMPTDERYLSFTNRWYKPGVQNREPYRLPNGRIIYIMSALYFVATKMEAVIGRGGEDLRMSHDFEDLIYVINYCADFYERFEKETNIELKTFLAEQCRLLLSRIGIGEEIECALPYGEEDRVEIIIDTLKTIARNKAD